MISCLHFRKERFEKQQVVLKKKKQFFFFKNKRQNLKNSTMTESHPSCFEMVGEFHQVFQHPIHTSPQFNIFDQHQLLQMRLNLIKEEVKELEEAIEKNDFEEVVDALCDIQYVTHGFAHVIGINLDRHFKHVHECNMTKVCQTEKEAQETLEEYKSNSKYSNPCYEKRGNYYVVFDHQSIHKSECKILKNKHWKQPNHLKLFQQ